MTNESEALRAIQGCLEEIASGPWRVDVCGVVTGGPDYLTTVCEVPVVRWDKSISHISQVGGGVGLADAQMALIRARSTAVAISALPRLISVLAQILLSDSSGDGFADAAKSAARAGLEAAFGRKLP